MEDQQEQLNKIKFLLEAIQDDHYSDDHPMIENSSLRIELMQMGEPAIQALKNAFSDPESPIAAHVAAKTLARYGDESVILPLIDIAKEKSIPSRPRFYAISALGELNDKRCIIRNAATGFLRRMGKVPYSVEEETFRGYLDTIRKRMNGLFDTPNADHKSRIKISRIIDNFLPYYFADDETYKKWGTLLEKCGDIPIDQLLVDLQQIHQELTPDVNTR